MNDMEALQKEADRLDETTYKIHLEKKEKRIDQYPRSYFTGIARIAILNPYPDKNGLHEVINIAISVEHGKPLAKLYFNPSSRKFEWECNGHKFESRCIPFAEPEYVNPDFWLDEEAEELFENVFK